ncbi:hypothetical protein PAHAL_9G009000 [Panicum hallii]|uniref:FRIGIDA-like protein n=1 Tax=Panicum hallii TaxID=206008 RepID=A0A2S3IG45_9POAL|nr:uncharacterized protein LOC112875320 [Panicum hallii]PAN43983.1 hypothetical protein PAHAL_9G009000 [Panicum hallii]
MPPSPPPASAASRAAMLQSVHSLASYSDTLADFLDQWNSVILDAASIAATFAVLFPGPEPDPKPLPAAEAQLSPAPEPERKPEPDLAPETEPNAVPEPEREREPSPSSEPERQPIPAPEPEGEPKPKPVREPAPAPEPEPEHKPAPNPVRERKDGDPSAAELDLRCKQMNFRELRRFVTAHVRDREWLRQVGPDALRRAEDPAWLVLRAVGRYYICAESGDAEAACMLLLELYVRAGCPRGRGQGHREAELRQEAREAALTWRSRLLRVSGRVGDAGAREARGLAFFMAAFGVPVEFPVQELYDLLVAADVSACTKVLKCSKLFVKKMRDVVVEMINRDMYLQAIHSILAFEFPNAFPLGSTLTHIMEKLEHDRKDENEGQALERDEEELALLRSISKCMEDHKLSLFEFPSFAERIVLLEERVGKPKQAFAGIKRKRTTEEDCVE